MSRLHGDHVRTHLERVRAGHVALGDVESVFLGAVDDESIQELIGFRMEGLGSTLLAVLSFERRGFPGILHARESLASYLTSPPRGTRPAPFAVGDGIPVLLPRADEGIPSFLRGLRAGRHVASMVLDPARIRLAFDFRGHNPSAVEAVRQAAGPLRTYVVRTVDGHVLAGRSHEIVGSRKPRFVALTDVHQFTPSGTYRLMDVMINATWIALWADVTDEKPSVPPRFWTPFLASGAAPDLALGLPADPALAVALPESAAPPIPATRFPTPGPR